VHWFVGSTASFFGGFCAGVVTNPIDIVYNRQAADALYPKGFQRSYSSFIDGLVKTHLEGALFRGSIASGCAYGMLGASMSYLYDFLKEYVYWFTGPTLWLRPMVLVPTAVVGTCLYLPFDNVKVRFHTMTALPNGEMPYKGTLSSLAKIYKYEANIWKYSTPIAFLSGGAPAFARIYSLLFMVNLMKFYFRESI
jgi:hypothetical protein